MPRRLTLALAAVLALAACPKPATKPKPKPKVPDHVLEIDIDDHGLAGLWAANAPNLKGLIANGTLAYTRVIVPTHSNQSNMALLTGQYPDGNDVPGNAWLDRSLKFSYPINLGPLSLGNYGFWDQNPLRIRGDSTYKYAESLGDKPAYFGQLPPFEAGADNVHFTIVGETLAGISIDLATAQTLMTSILKYPQSVIDADNFDGPGDPNESISHFVFHDAADWIAATPTKDIPRYMFLWDFIALDDDPTSTYGADGPALQKVIEDYDDALGLVLKALKDKGLLAHTDIIFTLDHGKVDTHNQVALGSFGGSASTPADGQLGDQVRAQGPALNITDQDYAIVNEDGDAQIYAKVPDAGTPAGVAEQTRVTHALVQIIQSGAIVGLDTTRTITHDGYMGTRRFHDYHDDGPYQADILVFPKDDWTLNQVDKNNAVPGPFQEHTQYPYGRHGGFSTDELYVPLIMSGPAFKKGVILPHPVNHPDVAATVAQILGGTDLTTGEGVPIRAALEGDPGETIPQPNDMTTSRPAVLSGSGYAGAPALAGAAATQAVVIDVAGVYYDEIFDDAKVPDSATKAWRDLAASGTSFESFYDRYRDRPVNAYEMLTGGYPVQDPWIPFATDDPDQTTAPGFGLLKMPVPAGFVSDPAGKTAWHTAQDFGVPTIFDTAKTMGMSTALIGQIDTESLHVDTTGIDDVKSTDAASAAGEVSSFLSANPNALVVVSLGGTRTGDRDSSAASSELAALGKAVKAVVAAAPGALIVITSRGATPVDDPKADFYGPQSSRHVPFIVLGPNAKSGVVTGMPGQAADVPATVLFGLGAASRTDFADGTWAAGTDVDGVPEPTPAGATGGHALLRAFDLK